MSEALRPPGVKGALRPAPARVTVGVAALPLGAQVEIDAIAGAG